MGCGLDECRVCLEDARRHRGWFYRVVTALAALLIFYGLVSAQEAAVWIALAGALTGCGVAAKHTPVRRRRRDS